MMISDADTTWMTYEEAARALTIKPDSVRRRATSRRWPRRVGNDGLARVGVPSNLLRSTPPESAPEAPPALPPDIGGDVLEVIRNERDQARIEAATLRVELAQVHERLAETVQHLNQRLADTQAEREREVAQLREDRDRWHVLATKPNPTPIPQPWLARIWASLRPAGV